ncbi:Lsm7p protein, putative [Leishmania panamensis]|uniref:Lsm7p protein n=6 Tax=Viannia TaxID=37616 RepID=A4HEK8_LEIBR|nr:putative Lsm7p protein [Leishmania braziliensis MHOM/BR/75/M2904]XP_010699824.1 Lsm7p protein, putative [Leishmania panamensis]KAI5685397.1 LSM domain containing protein [Leishmania braziliensis]CCM16294.1 Lsm7p protein, putative [Leishmania guyanensis]AIN99117.1 Lsm7p protein, putative [Leishmania panamensis]CAJ2474462.1 unnamed protein product [Leishmania braziliensis]CAJ2474987.1 unnamed protein product [Leishmania braziliensis]
MHRPARLMSAELAHILKKKEGILSLEKYLDRKVVVSQKGQEVHGVLKGFDNNVNLVLADAELWHGDTHIRTIGACVVRGGPVSIILSGDTTSIANPFA